MSGTYLAHSPYKAMAIKIAMFPIRLAQRAWGNVPSLNDVSLATNIGRTVAAHIACNTLTSAKNSVWYTPDPRIAQARNSLIALRDAFATNNTLTPALIDTAQANYISMCKVLQDNAQQYGITQDNATPLRALIIDFACIFHLTNANTRIDFPLVHENGQTTKVEFLRRFNTALEIAERWGQPHGPKTMTQRGWSCLTKSVAHTPTPELLECARLWTALRETTAIPDGLQTSDAEEKTRRHAIAFIQSIEKVTHQSCTDRISSFKMRELAPLLSLQADIEEMLSGEGLPTAYYGNCFISAIAQRLNSNPQVAYLLTSGSQFGAVSAFTNRAVDPRITNACASIDRCLENPTNEAIFRENLLTQFETIVANYQGLPEKATQLIQVIQEAPRHLDRIDHSYLKDFLLATKDELQRLGDTQLGYLPQATSEALAIAKDPEWKSYFNPSYTPAQQIVAASHILNRVAAQNTQANQALAAQELTTFLTWARLPAQETLFNHWFRGQTEYLANALTQGTWDPTIFGFVQNRLNFWSKPGTFGNRVLPCIDSPSIRAIYEMNRATDVFNNALFARSNQDLLLAFVHFRETLTVVQQELNAGLISVTPALKTRFDDLVTSFAAATEQDDWEAHETSRNQATQVFNELKTVIEIIVGQTTSPAHHTTAVPILDKLKAAIKDIATPSTSPTKAMSIETWNPNEHPLTPELNTLLYLIDHLDRAYDSQDQDAILKATRWVFATLEAFTYGEEESYLARQLNIQGITPGLSENLENVRLLLQRALDRRTGGSCDPQSHEFYLQTNSLAYSYIKGLGADLNWWKEQSLTDTPQLAQPSPEIVTNIYRKYCESLSSQEVREHATTAHHNLTTELVIYPGKERELRPLIEALKSIRLEDNRKALVTCLSNDYKRSQDDVERVLPLSTIRIQPTANIKEVPFTPEFETILELLTQLDTLAKAQNSQETLISRHTRFVHAFIQAFLTEPDPAALKEKYKIDDLILSHLNRLSDVLKTAIDRRAEGYCDPISPNFYLRPYQPTTDASGLTSSVFITDSIKALQNWKREANPISKVKTLLVGQPVINVQLPEELLERAMSLYCDSLDQREADEHVRNAIADLDARVNQKETISLILTFLNSDNPQIQKSGLIDYLKFKQKDEAQKASQFALEDRGLVGKGLGWIRDWLGFTPDGLVGQGATLVAQKANQVLLPQTSSPSIPAPQPPAPGVFGRRATTIADSLKNVLGTTPDGRFENFVDGITDSTSRAMDTAAYNTASLGIEKSVGFLKNTFDNSEVAKRLDNVAIEGFEALDKLFGRGATTSRTAATRSPQPTSSLRQRQITTAPQPIERTVRWADEQPEGGLLAVAASAPGKGIKGTLGDILANTLGFFSEVQENGISSIPATFLKTGTGYAAGLVEKYAEKLDRVTDAQKIGRLTEVAGLIRNAGSERDIKTAKDAISGLLGSFGVGGTKNEPTLPITDAYFIDIETQCAEALGFNATLPESIKPSKEITDAEKALFVKNTSRFAPLKFLLEYVCGAKSEELDFYGNLIKKAEKAGDENGERVVKEDLLKHLETLQVGWVKRQLVARVFYPILQGISAHYLSALADRGIDNLREFIEKNDKGTSSNFADRIVNRSNGYLAILKSAYRRIAKKDTIAGDLPSELDKELSLPQLLNGKTIDDAYAAFAGKGVDNFVKPEIFQGRKKLLKWINKKLEGNPIHPLAYGLAWISSLPVLVIEIPLRMAAIKLFKNMIFNGALVNSTIKQSLGAISKNGYTHALNCALHNRLSKLFMNLCSHFDLPANPSVKREPAPAAIDVNNMGIVQKDKLRTLVKELLECLKFEQCNSPDDVRKLINQESLLTRAETEVEDLAYPRVADSVAEVLGASLYNLLSKDFLDAQICQIITSMNHIYDESKPVSEKDFKAKEEEITQLTRVILKLIVSKTIDQKFDFDRSHEQKAADRFLEEVNTLSEKLVSNIREGLQKLEDSRGPTRALLPTENVLHSINDLVETVRQSAAKLSDLRVRIDAAGHKESGAKLAFILSEIETRLEKFNNPMLELQDSLSKCRLADRIKDRLDNMGENVNVILRHLNSGSIGNVSKEIRELREHFKILATEPVLTEQTTTLATHIDRIEKAFKQINDANTLQALLNSNDILTIQNVTNSDFKAALKRTKDALSKLDPLSQKLMELLGKFETLSTDVARQLAWADAPRLLAWADFITERNKVLESIPEIIAKAKQEITDAGNGCSAPIQACKFTDVRIPQDAPQNMNLAINELIIWNSASHLRKIELTPSSIPGQSFISESVKQFITAQTDQKFAGLLKFVRNPNHWKHGLAIHNVILPMIET